MHRARAVLALFALAAAVAAQDTTKKGGEDPPRRKEALDEAFHGRVVEIKKRTVTLHYDFEDPAQLEDFEEARPPRLLDATRDHARIEDGRLVLEGSTSIRHRMESAGCIRATFTVRVREKRNVGAVITEPVLGDFYVVYSLFDYRFNGRGAMHVAACGLREDEGAEDPTSGLVNFRDIFSGNLGKAEAGKDIRVEVRKEGFKELFCADDVKGKGSSKGKTKEMKDMMFGLFVHGSGASFDDLTLTCELGDAYLDLENLRPEVDAARPAATGPRR